MQQAVEYSRIVREVADQTGTGYLPLNETLMERLRENPSSPRLPYERWRYVVYKALFQKKIFRMSLDSISRANGFHYLVDYVHLNGRGARVVADLVREFLETASSGER